MSKNKIGEDSPIPKIIHLKIRREDGVESETILEESELNVPIDGCIRSCCQFKNKYPDLRKNWKGKKKRK